MLQLIYYVPDTHLEVTKNALFDIGCGQLGNYSRCAWQTKGVGQFMPNQGADPFIGTADALEYVNEFKVELLVPQALIAQAIAVLKQHHPYECPAYAIIELVDFKSLF
ncbi:MAG: NGG1p interacting factor NIF3 [Francisellaceae bacterium]